MTAVSVSFDGTRVDDANAVGAWDNFGTGTKASLNNDFFTQATGSISRKVTTSIDGIELDGPTPTVNFTSPARIAHLKYLVTTVGVLSPKGPDGAVLYIGSAQADYHEYWVDGGDTWPATKSWLSKVINPNLVGYRSGTTGTPVLTAVDYYAFTARMTATVRDDNVAMDAIDYYDVGKGLTLVGGDGASPDGIFQDFLAFDENIDTNRQNVVHSIDIIIFVNAMLTIGSATATVFNDANRILIFLDGLFDAGTTGVTFGQNNAANDVDITGTIFIGRGASVTKKFFDTALQVLLGTPTFESLTLLGHGLSNTDYITYSREGGSNDIGPEPGDFWVGVVDVDTIVLFANFADAFNFDPDITISALFASFDCGPGVNGTTEVITTLAVHGLQTGQAVFHDRDGGSSNTGLTDLTIYWVNVISTTTVSMHTSKADAKSDTSRVDLTPAASETHLLLHTTAPEVLTAATAPGENHSIIKKYETRPDITVTGTSGDWDTLNCIYSGIANITLTSICNILGGFMRGIGKITISTAGIDGVDIDTATTEEGQPLIAAASTIANIDNCVVNAAAEGHFVELTSTGTFAFDGNILTGFWNPATNGWKFDTITGVDAGTEVITTDALHGFITGEAVFYNSEGGDDTVGLTNLAKYYVNVLSTTTLSIHLTRAAAVADTSRINLSDGAEGEPHSLYSGRAAIFNNSGGVVTINVGPGATTPSVRNGSGATTTVNNAVTVEVTGVTEGTRCSIKTLTGTVLLNALAFTADGTGAFKASTSFAFVSPTTVQVTARSQGKPVAAVSEEDGVGFTDETIVANDRNTNMTLMPSPASINDAYYFGHHEQFGAIQLDIGTLGVGGAYAFEYHNGTIWTAVSGLSDGTSGLTQDGIISFTIPGDWVTQTVNSQGPYFYFRIRATTAPSTSPVGKKVTMDVTRYQTDERQATIIATGLSFPASWVEDPVATFGNQ